MSIKRSRVLAIALCIAPLFAGAGSPVQPTEAVERFGALALACVHQEYPNKLSHVLSTDADALPPRTLTPAFYGCYDWHSSVHGHWLLARLARTFPEAKMTAAAKAALAKSLTPENIAQEVAYLQGAGRASFERPYGLAWLLQLAAELRGWDDPLARTLSARLDPLEDAAAARLKEWLPKLSHPVRSGEHSQSAFALGLIIDSTRDEALRELARSAVRRFYLRDRDCPLAYEPSGEDFLSPCIAEADVMRRVLPPDAYAAWLTTFMPGGMTLVPAVVTDPTDPKLAHLDGLNLSRAWMLDGIASALQPKDPRYCAFVAAATAHGEAGQKAITGEHYEGGHWLGSFATYYWTRRGIADADLTQCCCDQSFAEDMPAGQALSAWLDAVNSGDRDAVVAYDKRFQQPEKDPERILGLHAATGGFNLVRIEKSEPLVVTALLQEKASDTMVRFELALTADAPPKIAGAKLERIETPPDLAVPRLSHQAALDALDARIQQNAKDDTFSGVVLVAQRGETVFVRAAGLADREKPLSVENDTQFRLGSMNKMFTTVAILQLIDAGKLTLDDPIGKHLTDYPNADLAAKVTVRHLLTHTGGTGDIFGPAFDQKRLALRTHDDYLKLYGARPLAFEPGSKQAYSNYGFILLGALVERLSGSTYYDYVDTRIFALVGMKHTGSLPETTDVPGRAVGYMKQGGAWVRNDDTLPWRGTAAGGGYSTAPDLLRFAQALQSGKLISSESLRRATTDKGLGFFVSGQGALRSYGHSGGAPGMNGDLRIYPELGTVIIALSNLDPMAAERLSDYYARRMPAG